MTHEANTVRKAHDWDAAYNEIINKAAAEIEMHSRNGQAVYVWAIATTKLADGYLHVGIAPPAHGIPPIVRPCDNNSSTYSEWRHVPFSQIEHVLWHACRREPILPIDR